MRMGETFRTTIEIAAAPDLVFEYFLRPELLVRWMGDRARLEARDGGAFAVDINGVLIRGHFVRVERPYVLEIAWGEAGNDAMPPGSTRIVVRLIATPGGTRVELEHHGLTREESKKHAIGWPHFLGRLVVLAAGGDPGADPWATRRLLV
jgi:uncharacterized protein YndB with AHSA1/START domain